MGRMLVDSYDNIVRIIFLSLARVFKYRNTYITHYGYMISGLCRMSIQSRVKIRSVLRSARDILEVSCAARSRDTPITQRPCGQSSYASNRHDRPILHRSRSDNGLLRGARAYVQCVAFRSN